MTTGPDDLTATARLLFDASSLRSGVRDANQSLGSLYDVVRDNWWGIRNVGLAFAGVGAAISGGVGLAVKAAADFEQGMAGVARTTFDASKSADENAAAVGRLADQLREVARTRPVDLKTITGIAEQAGALGVASKDVAQFTSTITDLVATTNLTADSATQLARVAGIFGLSATQYKNLGSAIFETGRSTAATESEILKMTTRLAGAGKAAGLTADQVVGLSAATLSLGPRAEAGTSALQRTLFDLAKAASSADPTKLEAFAKVAGTTADAFKALITNDPGKALTAFIEGLGKQGTNAVQTEKIMSALGITEVRQIQALAALAAGTTNVNNENVQLKNVLELSNKAFVDGTAVTKAAAAQYGTLQNQLKILHNNINDVFLSIGTLYLPAVKSAVGVTGDFVAGLDNLPPSLRSVAVGLTSVVGSGTAAAGLFLLMAPRVILARDAYAKLTSALNVAVTSATAMEAAQSGMAATSLRTALAAGLHAKAMAAESKLTGDAAAAELFRAQALKATTAAEQAAGQAEALRAKLLSGVSKSAASATELEVMRAQATKASAAAVVASADAEKIRATILAGTVVEQGKATAANSSWTASLSASRALTAEEIVALEAKAAALEATALAQTQAAAATNANIAAQSSDIALTVEETVAIQAQTAALEELAIVQGQTAKLAGASALALTSETAAAGGARTAVYGLGAALRFLTGPIGIVLTLLSAAAIAVTLFGKSQQDNTNTARSYASAQDDITAAIRNQANGQADAVRQLIATKLAMSGAVEIADRYGISIEDLYRIITGTSPAAAQRFVATLSRAYQNGDRDARTLGNTVQQLAQQYAASARVANANTAANRALGVAENEAAAGAYNAANASVTAANAAEAQATAAVDLVNALLGLQSAQYGVEDATTSVSVAQSKGTKTSRDAEQEAIDLARAYLDLAAAEQGVRDAEDNVRTARARQIADLKDAEATLQDDRDAAAEAADAVTAAQEHLNEVEGKGKQKALDLMDATNKLKDAQLKLVDSQQEVSDAQFLVNYLIGQGASARDIADAQRNLDKANQDVADSTEGVAQAQQNVVDTQKKYSPAAVAKAERDLAKAKRDSAKASAEVVKQEKEVAKERRDLRNNTYYKQAEIDLKNAELDLRDAQHRVYLQTHKQAEASGAAAGAARGLAHQSFNVEQAYVREAQAAVEVQKQTALAEGKTWTARDAAEAYANELDRLGTKAGGQVGKHLHELAAKIRANLPKATVKIDADTTKADQAVPKAISNYNTQLDQFKAKHEGFLSKILTFGKSDPVKLIAATLAGIGAAIAVIIFAPAELVGAALIGIALAVGALVGFLVSHLPGSWTKTLKNMFSKILPDQAGQGIEKLKRIFSPKALSGFFSGLGHAFMSFVKGIPGFFAGVPGMIGHAFSAAGTAIIGFFTALPGRILKELAALPGQLGTFFGTTVPYAIGSALGILVGIIYNIIATAFTVSGAILGVLLSFGRDLITHLGQDLQDAILGLWHLAAWFTTWIGKEAPRVYRAVANFMTLLPGRMWTAFTTTARTSWDLARFIGNETTTWLPRVGPLLMTFMRHLPGLMWTAFVNLATTTFNFTRFLANQAASWLAAIPGTLTHLGHMMASGIWNAFHEQARILFRGVVAFLTGFFDHLPKGLQDSMKSIGDAIKGPINTILQHFNNIMDTIGKFHFKLAGWSIGKVKIPGITVDLNAFSNLKVPLLAEGGIANRATLGVFGEKGPEAIIPLTKLWEMLRPLTAIAAQTMANTAALHQLAATGSLGGGGKTINNYYDTAIETHSDASAEDIGREVAWATR